MEIIRAQFPRKVTVGQCIYCGVNDVPLQKEHIVPYSLGGSWVLHEASCSQCADVTRKFEGIIATEQALVIRTIANLPTRRKHKRPSRLPLKVKRAGQEETIDIPVEIYPIHLALEVYSPPVYLDRRPYERGINVRGIVTRGSSPQVLRDKLNIDGYTVTANLVGLTQSKLLAKIAYGFAVYLYRASIINGAYVLPSIRGQRDDLGMWVGNVSEFPPGTWNLQATSNLHQIRLGIDANHNILASVWLFAKFGAPEYLVIVGPAP